MVCTNGARELVYHGHKMCCVHSTKMHSTRDKECGWWLCTMAWFDALVSACILDRLFNRSNISLSCSNVSLASASTHSSRLLIQKCCVAVERSEQQHRTASNIITRTTQIGAHFFKCECECECETVEEQCTVIITKYEMYLLLKFVLWLLPLHYITLHYIAELLIYGCVLCCAVLCCCSALCFCFCFYFIFFWRSFGNSLEGVCYACGVLRSVEQCCGVWLVYAQDFYR